MSLKIKPPRKLDQACFRLVALPVARQSQSTHEVESCMMLKHLTFFDSIDIFVGVSMVTMVPCSWQQQQPAVAM